MGWSKFPGRARDTHGAVLSNVKVFVDYNDSTTNRSSAVLEIKDYVQGNGDTLSITASNADDFTLTEGTDFTAKISNSETAENIAREINGKTNYSAQATATGASGNPYVSIHYSNGNITGTTTGDSGAWDWYTVNSSDAIATIASDDTGTVRHQPIFTNSDGIVSCYINGTDGGKVDIDVVPEKSGYTTDSTYTEDISIPT